MLNNQLKIFSRLHKGFTLSNTLIILLFITVSFITFLIGLKYNLSLKVTSPEPVTLSNKTNRAVISEEENKKYTEESNLKTFLNDYYADYTIMADIDKTDIQRAFYFSLIENPRKLGWLVEVKNHEEVEEISYYLLHYRLQKKLNFVGTQLIGIDRPYCKINSPSTRSIKINSTSKISDNNRYLILTGSCGTYYNEISNFVSVYNFGSGKKIMLENTDNGTYLGVVKQIVNGKKLSLVVQKYPHEYENFDITVFDIPSGRSIHEIFLN